MSRKIDVQQIAEVYRQAVTQGVKPRIAVMSEFGLVRQTAAYWIRRARDAGHLPPGQGRAFVGSHQPRWARFDSRSEPWLACASCHHPWPCGQERAA